ncbi:MAG: hypothetical protein QOD99_967 [Chthoniobacter sp.]|nr:hypothetical protein [Chthoniobacter sp.]
MKRFSVVALAVVLAFACGLFLTPFLRQAGKKPLPNVDGLAQVLKTTADEKLSSPALTNEQIALHSPSAEMETRTKEVIDAAIQSGGTAFKTTGAGGSAIVLAKIPGQNVEAFRAMVKKESAASGAPVREGEAHLIEITISPQ